MKDKQKIKDRYKIDELNDVLVQNFGKELNLARIKFISLFICALCKMQTVCFEKLACAFTNNCKTESSLRRIQRFMADFNLDSDKIFRLIFRLLPHEPPFRLAMDRTNWKFGETNINVLTLAVVYQGVAFPVLFKMLPKFGNSHTKERIQILERYIRLFGKHTIDCLLADREFVGEHWIKYLNCNNIRYYIRIRGNFYVENPRNGKRIKATWLFSSLKVGECCFLHKIYRVKGQLCFLSASKIRNRDNIPELQVIISFDKPENAIQTYKERWQIETAFRALKSSGFNIEDTHLTDLERIEKLFTLVLLAFTWAYIVGIFLHKNVKPVRIKKDGKKTKSFFHYGLNFIANILLNANNQSNINIFKFLSCT
jgi:hypothetical protein